MEQVSIGVLCTVCGFILSYLAFNRNKTKDDKQDGKQDGTILTEIGYIKGGIDDIKKEQISQRTLNTEFISRLTRCEESAKQAHKRIEELKGSIHEKYEDVH